MGVGVGGSWHLRSLRYWKPFLIVLIEANNFEGAEALVEGGARADVCEWLREGVGGGANEELRASHRLHWRGHFFCPGKTPLHSPLLTPTKADGAHSEKLQLLKRLVAVAVESNTRCLQWPCAIPVRTCPLEERFFTERCTLSLACLVLDPRAVAELLTFRGAELSPEEGGRLIGVSLKASIDEGPVGLLTATDRNERERRCIKVLEALAEKGADLSAVIVVADKRETALCFACCMHMGALVDFLLRKGVSPKKKETSASDLIPLVIAIEHQNWSVAKTLLEWGADPNEVHGWGVSAVEAYLRHARSVESPQLRMEILEALAKAGADFEARLHYNDNTPLTFACRNELEIEIDFLLRQGLTWECEVVNCALVDCMKGGKWGVVKRLLKEGADPNCVHEVDGNIVSPVEAYLDSAEGESTEIRMELLHALGEAGANFEVPFYRHFGHGRATPLSVACEKGMLPEIDFFLRQGVSVHEWKNKDGNGLLFHCFKKRQWLSAKKLLEWGADPNEVSVSHVDPWKGGGRVLTLPLVEVMKYLRHYWVDCENFTNAVELLVEKGARCEMVEEKGEALRGGEGGRIPLSSVSALVLACSSCDATVVRLLVEKAGADPNAKGKTRDDPDETAILPLEAAMRGTDRTASQIFRLVTTLIQLGARLDLLETPEEDFGFWLNDAILGRDCPVNCHGPPLENLIRDLPASVINKKTVSRCTYEAISPLDAALAANYTEGVRALVDAGADVNSPVPTELCLERGMTKPLFSLCRTDGPLLFALATRQWKAAEILIRAGADTAYVRKQWDLVSLTAYVPALSGCPAPLLSLILQPLLRQIPCLNELAQLITCPESESQSLEGTRRAVSLLIDALRLPSCHGFLLEQMICHLPLSVLNGARDETTPIGAALSTNSQEGVKILVEAGANVTAPTRTGKSFTERRQRFVAEPAPPLLLALALRQWGVAKVLVRAGADTECVKRKGAQKPRPRFLEEAPRWVQSIVRGDFPW
uniref:Uncharacterized protein n=1 Tax=Chromera velia CCMP2878 TaxID=1169474 RepID=A0A0G4G6K3_9ALVE|eukprot:Cvel_20410.t1-p1 / transcript=Cvel_20410.t1 / gene=Cvel_20410 / organism=Chromera_velia_CCMP2878 / gene_product=Putative ankyrin repeat protein RBE_0220, putative / transcript_product=Putative ankyrin repeat protein RBE_0220, putative / location=Cvel_scaffold1828:14162-17364(+) / protein_length=993 / sequence_SO=supercontig / SO=protein_coding / is_pseudo=false